MKDTLVSEIRSELHTRLDALLDRLVITARAEAITEVSDRLSQISELSAFNGQETLSKGPPRGDLVPFGNGAISRGSRATSPSIVHDIIHMRDEAKLEWNEIVDRLKKSRTKTVTGVPWSRDNVIKLYQTARSKVRKQSDGRKLQGKYMGLLRAVPAKIGQKAKGVRKSTGLVPAIRFLESERKKVQGARMASEKAARKAA